MLSLSGPPCTTRWPTIRHVATIRHVERASSHATVTARSLSRRSGCDDGNHDKEDEREDRLMRHVKYALVACVIAAFAAGNSGAANYETQFNKPAKDAVPPTVAAGPDFKVNDPVVADGYMYRFTVTSTYGPFEVTGIGALRKLEQEIWAIGQLKNVTRSEAFLKSLKDQAGKPLVFAKDVITKPVDTLTGIPKGVGRLFGNIVTSVTTTRNPSQESRVNAVLQEELDKIGKAAAFGSWTASAAMIPISGPASSVITGTSLGKSFNNILATEPPSRIRIINEDKLK